MYIYMYMYIYVYIYIDIFVNVYVYVYHFCGAHRFFRKSAGCAWWKLEIFGCKANSIC
jgi:hypothetical protein